MTRFFKLAKDTVRFFAYIAMFGIVVITLAGLLQFIANRISE
jgi:hypothetical protein